MHQILTRSDPIRRHAPGARYPTRFVWVALGLFALPFLWIGTPKILKGLDLLLAGEGTKGTLRILGGLLCCVPGGLALLLARYNWRCDLRQVETVKLHPEEPWLWRKEWSGGLFESRDYVGLVVLWVFTTLWIGVAGPASVLFLLEALANGHWAGFLVAVFPAIGVWLLASSVRHTRYWRKFGESSFRMERLPATLGGELVGTLHTRAIEHAEAGLLVRVSCVRQTREEGASQSTTREELLWSDEERIPVQAVKGDSGDVMLPIRFALPSDAPPSHALLSHDQVVWRLETSAELPGADYESSFEIPVFQTRETDPERTMSVLAMERPRAVGTSTTPSAPEPARERTRDVDSQARDTESRSVSPEGVLMDFPPVRWWGAATFLTALGSFLGYIASLIHEVMDSSVGVFIVGGFAALLIFGAVHMIGGSTRLRVRSDGVDIQRRLFGIGPTQHVPASRIADLEISREMTYGKTAYYGIRLLPQLSGPTWSGFQGIKAGTRIFGRDKAERTARRIRAILAL